MKYTVHALWVYCIKGHLWIDNKKLDSALSQKVPSKVSQQITVAIVFFTELFREYSHILHVHCTVLMVKICLLILFIQIIHYMAVHTFTDYKSPFLPSNFIFLLCWNSIFWLLDTFLQGWAPVLFKRTQHFCVLSRSL